MFRALALVFVLPLAALAGDPPAKKPVDQLDRLYAVLHEKKLASFEGTSIRTMQLHSLKVKLEKEFRDDGLRIIVREDLFRAKFPDAVTDRVPFSDSKLHIDLKPDGLTLHECLTAALPDIGAVYRAKPRHIEIVPEEAAEPLARQLELLHESAVSSFGPGSIKDTTLGALKSKLEKEFWWGNLKLVIREDLFRLQYPDKAAFSEVKFKVDLKPNGLTLHELLAVALADVNAVYLVRRNYLEITTPEAAVAECYTGGRKGESPQERLRREPLVSLHAHGQGVFQLTRVLSERYGKPVIVDPAVGQPPRDPFSLEVRSHESIVANWANVPYPTAIRLLALEAGLDVKELDGALTLTKPVQKKKGK